MLDFMIVDCHTHLWHAEHWSEEMNREATMKTQIVIIEDNDCKFFTTKAVLETQLKLTVNVVDVTMGGDIVEAVQSVDPDIISNILLVAAMGVLLDFFMDTRLESNLPHPVKSQQSRFHVPKMNPSLLEGRLLLTPLGRTL